MKVINYLFIWDWIFRYTSIVALLHAINIVMPSMYEYNVHIDVSTLETVYEALYNVMV